MTSTALAAPRPSVLADAHVPHSALSNVALVVGGTAVTALLAQLTIPLWPVPITGQTLAVLLVGSALGANRGALAMLLYWVVGMAGAPIYSDGGSGLAAAFGPSGGYIMGFMVAAYAVGKVAERGGDRNVLKAALSFLAGTVITFAFGMAWLALSTGAGLQQTLEWGLYPFIAGGLIKSAIAAGIMPLAWKASSRLRDLD